MTALHEYLKPDEIQQVAGLQLFARQVVEGFCTGLHRSPHQGVSVEFRQHRQYVPGDEIRHVDWKVFGKSDRYYIRQFEEETNLRAMLLLDCSGSMSFRNESVVDSVSKHTYACRLAACLAYLLLRQQDSVGLVTFDEQLRRLIPPRSRISHLHHMLAEMETREPGGESELGPVFREVIPRLPRRSLLFVISDCLSNLDELLTAFAHFRLARHEVVVFQIWDRAEIEFPYDQWTRFDCLESAGVNQLVDPAHLRQAYLENLDRFRSTLEDGCHRNRIDLVPLITDQPVTDALSHYLAWRRRRA